MSEELVHIRATAHIGQRFGSWIALCDQCTKDAGVGDSPDKALDQLVSRLKHDALHRGASIYDNPVDPESQLPESLPEVETHRCTDEWMKRKFYAQNVLFELVGWWNNKACPPKLTREQICSAESTRDAIFLFQACRLDWNGVPEGWEAGDDCFISRTIKGEGDKDDYEETMTLKELLDSGLSIEDHDTPCVTEEWKTESVWLTREEAEQFGRAKAYNYADGWRVYCVCAEGELAALLRGQNGDRL